MLAEGQTLTMQIRSWESTINLTKVLLETQQTQLFWTILGGWLTEHGQGTHPEPDQQTLLSLSLGC